MSKLTSKGVDAIKQIVNDATSDPHRTIPGLSVSIINNKGEDLVSYANGVKSADSSERVSTDSLWWLASCTKIVATIAVLQLVEQGRLDLDDSDQLESIIPELKHVPIASVDSEGNIVLKPKTKRITLRMLLSHTSGFGYSFFSPVLQKWKEYFAVDEFNASLPQELLFPLLFEPGTDWQYGVGIDWAGVALERVTGEKLGDYIKNHILIPLGLTESSFTPDELQRSKLVDISRRDGQTGELSTIKHYYQKVVTGSYDELFFHSGGAGLFSKPHDYVQILSVILNDGESPKTGARILSKDFVDLLFTNQIPQWPDFGRRGLPDADPLLTNALDEIYPQGSAPQGWGLSWFLTPEPGATGRGANTAFWCGIANCFYWCDREKGIAGMVAGQILPFGDAQVLGSWVQIESAVYANLE